MHLLWKPLSTQKPFDYIGTFFSGSSDLLRNLHNKDLLHIYIRTKYLYWYLLPGNLIPTQNPCDCPQPESRAFSGSPYLPRNPVTTLEPASLGLRKHYLGTLVARYPN